MASSTKLPNLKATSIESGTSYMASSTKPPNLVGSECFGRGYFFFFLVEMKKSGIENKEGSITGSHVLNHVVYFTLYLYSART